MNTKESKQNKTHDSGITPFYTKVVFPNSTAKEKDKDEK